MQPRGRLAALLFAAIALLGCSEPTEPVCTGSVTVTATSAATPTFSWAPNCLVDQVYVEESIAPSAGGPQPRWIIASQVPGRGTPSPVTYGEVPFSMREVFADSALVVGHHYRVIVRDSATTELGAAVFDP